MENLITLLRLRIRKEPKPGGQKVLVGEETIDNLLARHVENQNDVAELLDAFLEERMQDIQEFDETLRNQN